MLHSISFILPYYTPFFRNLSRPLYKILNFRRLRYMNTLFTLFSSRSPVLTTNLLLLPYLGIPARCAATRKRTDLFPFVSQIRFQRSSHQLHTRSWRSSLLCSRVGTEMDLAWISPLPLPLLPPACLHFGLPFHVCHPRQ